MAQNENDYFSKSMHPMVGIVEEVVDETYIRVRAFGIHPNDKNKVRTDQLPPSLVVYPTTGGQVSGGAMSHNIEVDSWVMGWFLDYPVCMQSVVTGVFQGTDYSMSTASSGGGEFVSQGSSNIDIDIDATINLTGNSNPERVYNFVTSKLTSEGFTGDKHIISSAIVGCLMLEATPQIDPAIEGGYKGRAWGVCQWLGSRRTRLFAKYGKTKRLDQQLDFMWHELNTVRRYAKGHMLRATTLEEAMVGICYFEGAEEVQKGRVIKTHKNFKMRMRFAYQIYNTLKPSVSA